MAARPFAGAQKFTAAKKIAKMPSSTITMKIDLTTDAVTLPPSDFGRAADREALGGGDDADDQRHERRLDHAGLEPLEVDRVLQPREKADRA